MDYCSPTAVGGAKTAEGGGHIFIVYQQMTASGARSTRLLATGYFFSSSSIFSYTLINGFTKSMGMGNRVVEFFSVAISLRV
jgi:hypothetical protein